MVKRGFLVAAIFFAATTYAYGTPSEQAQNRSYTMCLAKKGIDPKHIPKDVSEACMEEAGIPNPGDEARELNRENFRNCLISSAVSLDDHISPATDIAKALTTVCAPQWKAYVDSLWLPPMSKYSLASDPESATNFALQIVLLERKVTKNHSGLR